MAKTAITIPATTITDESGEGLLSVNRTKSF